MADITAELAALPKMPPRIVCWFSCGDASAVATKLAIRLYKNANEVVVARINLSTEHPDNDRFSAECARWFGVQITDLRSDEFADTWEVWESRRYIAGIKGAPCTTEMKKVVRYKFQRPDDIHVFGFTAEPNEVARAERMRRSNHELEMQLRFPLIEHGLTKADCHAIVRSAGIELPMMYRLGFDNNNCIGCPKGGAGYWNMIRKHFPEQFTRMAELSRRLGARLIKQDGQRIYLDELRPDTGRQKDEIEISCSPMCDDASAYLAHRAKETT